MDGRIGQLFRDIVVIVDTVGVVAATVLGMLLLLIQASSPGPDRQLLSRFGCWWSGQAAHDM